MRRLPRRAMVLAGAAALLAAGITAWPRLEAAAPAPKDPRWIGNSRAVAAEAIATTSSRPRGEGMIGLARAWLGRPYDAFSLDRTADEELRIDLTRFDCFLFVEQLLALVNSSGTDGFSETVRRLRYAGGRVSYCERQHYFSRWVEAAERQGLLSDLTPSLPGALRRRRALTFMSSHPGSYRPMARPANRSCITDLERDLVVQQTYVPLARLAEAERRLRNGDVFALVTKVPGLDVTHVGLIERTPTGVNAIHAAPERGVMRSVGFARYAASVPEVVGVAFWRPGPQGLL